MEGCNELLDINESCEGNAGGILVVGAESESNVTIAYDAEGEVESVTTLRRFRTIPMRRGRGNYTDTSTIDRATGVSTNAGTLTVTIPRRSKAVLRSIKRMGAGQRDLCIIYKDGNKKCWLLPSAYLSTKEGASGQNLTDANGETIGFVQEGDFQEHGLEISEEIFNSLFDPIEPEIEELTPTTGEVGDEVHIIGRGFTDATSVKFGTVTAAVLTIVSDTVIKTVIPATLTAGVVQVTVESPEGVSEGVSFTVTV